MHLSKINLLEYETKLKVKQEMLVIMLENWSNLRNYHQENCSEMHSSFESITLPGKINLKANKPKAYLAEATIAKTPPYMLWLKESICCFYGTLGTTRTKAAQKHFKRRFDSFKPKHPKGCFRQELLQLVGPNMSSKS